MAVLWSVDRGLDKLLAQVNAAAPGRSKASDGSIGDPAHQATDSDHNPEHPPPAGNPDQQVDARDFTHDPAHGADMRVVSEAIRESKDPRVSYVIFNRRIFSGPNGPQPWVWRPYNGTNPHDKHMHVSVRDATHDQTQAWSIQIGQPSPEVPDMTPAQAVTLEAMAWRIEAVLQNLPVVRGGPTAGEVNKLAVAVKAAAGDPITDAQLAELVAAAKAGAEAGNAELVAEVRDAVADLGEGGSAQVRADVG